MMAKFEVKVSSPGRDGLVENIMSTPLLDVEPKVVEHAFPFASNFSDMHLLEFPGHGQLVSKRYGGRGIEMPLSIGQARAMSGLAKEFYLQLRGTGLNVSVLRDAYPVRIFGGEHDGKYHVQVLQEYVPGQNAVDVFKNASGDERQALFQGLLKATQIITNSRPYAYTPQNPFESPIGFDAKPHNFMLTQDGDLVLVDLYAPLVRDPDGGFAFLRVIPELAVKDAGFQSLAYRLADKRGLYTKSILELAAVVPEAKTLLEEETCAFLRKNEPAVLPVVEGEVNTSYRHYLSIVGDGERARFKPLTEK